ncbi:hypothetical protein BLNAU_1237 [Blattamonas nauphoetae]|uniref:TLDc domain-containing protein n=1 Tax=Blattamonas nauphoetae TaxID=2049346 RepID=A0ABQ9YIW5_9EUKA|nr:hypothetical protein BLNAU_1237 [Blattamonas nauphoetae]
MAVTRYSFFPNYCLNLFNNPKPVFDKPDEQKSPFQPSQSPQYIYLNTCPYHSNVFPSLIHLPQEGTFPGLDRLRAPECPKCQVQKSSQSSQSIARAMSELSIDANTSASSRPIPIHPDASFSFQVSHINKIGPVVQSAAQPTHPEKADTTKDTTITTPLHIPSFGSFNREMPFSPASPESPDSPQFLSKDNFRQMSSTFDDTLPSTLPSELTANLPSLPPGLPMASLSIPSNIAKSSFPGSPATIDTFPSNIPTEVPTALPRVVSSVLRTSSSSSSFSSLDDVDEDEEALRMKRRIQRVNSDLFSDPDANIETPFQATQTLLQSAAHLYTSLFFLLPLLPQDQHPHQTHHTAPQPFLTSPKDFTPSFFRVNEYWTEFSTFPFTSPLPLFAAGNGSKSHPAESGYFCIPSFLVQSIHIDTEPQPESLSPVPTPQTTPIRTPSPAPTKTSIFSRNRTQKTQNQYSLSPSSTVQAAPIQPQFQSPFPFIAEPAEDHFKSERTLAQLESFFGVRIDRKEEERKTEILKKEVMGEQEIAKDETTESNTLSSSPISIWLTHLLPTEEERRQQREKEEEEQRKRREKEEVSVQVTTLEIPEPPSLLSQMLKKRKSGMFLPGTFQQSKEQEEREKKEAEEKKRKLEELKKKREEERQLREEEEKRRLEAPTQDVISFIQGTVTFLVPSTRPTTSRTLSSDLTNLIHTSIASLFPHSTNTQDDAQNAQNQSQSSSLQFSYQTDPNETPQASARDTTFKSSQDVQSHMFSFFEEQGKTQWHECTLTVWFPFDHKIEEIESEDEKRRKEEEEKSKEEKKDVTGSEDIRRAFEKQQQRQQALADEMQKRIRIEQIVERMNEKTRIGRQRFIDEIKKWKKELTAGIEQKELQNKEEAEKARRSQLQKKSIRPKTPPPKHDNHNDDEAMPRPLLRSTSSFVDLARKKSESPTLSQTSVPSAHSDKQVGMVRGLSIGSDAKYPNLVSNSESRVLTFAQAALLDPHIHHSALTGRAGQQMRWTRVYSSDENGTSFTTICRCCQDKLTERRSSVHSFASMSSILLPCLLVVRDKKMNVFGAFLSQGLTDNGRKYYGNKNTFVWRFREENKTKDTKGGKKEESTKMEKVVHSSSLPPPNQPAPQSIHASPLTLPPPLSAARTRRKPVNQHDHPDSDFQVPADRPSNQTAKSGSDDQPQLTLDVFQSTQKNRYYIISNTDLIAVGGGHHFSLCLFLNSGWKTRGREDGSKRMDSVSEFNNTGSFSLDRGSSNWCDTFDSPPLAGKDDDVDFAIDSVEIWGWE